MKEIQNSEFFDLKLGSLSKKDSKKIISFSLYGTNQKYYSGAIPNIEHAKKYYPDWICRFYCTEDVPNLEEISNQDCEIIILDSKIPPMFWRYFSIDDPDVSVSIFRDTDSVVNDREAQAVKEWLSIDKKMHLMHDCKSGHWSDVMGGMCGIKGPLEFSISEKINNFCKEKSYKWRYSQDQTFLSKKILPIFKGSCIDHHFNPEISKYPYSVEFPPHEPLEFGVFVGQRVSLAQYKSKKYADLNTDSDKLFIMNHQSKGDFSKPWFIEFLKYISSNNTEVVIPCKEVPLNFLEEKDISDKISLKLIKHDADAISIFEKDYISTHKFLGLGSHAIKNKNQRLNLSNCLLEAGIDKKDFELKLSLISDSKFSNKTVEKEKPKSQVEILDIDNTHNKFLNNPKEEKVSVIIGTFNRWKYLLKSIESVKSQTYKNIEIIVVNDGSTDEEYFNSVPKGVTWLNLPENSEQTLGFRCRSYTYNYGLKIAKGKYIAFLDDDDAWYPKKIEKQISLMEKYNCGMSCTESLQGRGLFDSDKNYKIYMGGMKKRFQKWKVSEKVFNSDSTIVPGVWNKRVLLIHNFCIGSSVMVEKSIVDKVGFLNESRKLKKGQDYELWKRVLSITDCAYVDEPLTYYDHAHGKGRQY
jgi:GT2 family glycosyltransferase